MHIFYWVMFMQYVVQKGDTLYGISKQFGVSVDDLKRVNNLSSSNISVGSVLRIPSSGNVNHYQVQKGDTLYSISKKYNIPVSELVTLNNLANTFLQVGQVLVIPEDHLEDIYVVKKGDTLYSIAKQFGMSVSDLIRINQLTSSQLSVGQKLILSSNSSSEIPIGSSCYGDTYQEIEYITYTVKKGDNLYSISKKYGVSVSTIQKLNQLTNTNLSIGQVLKIKEVS